VPLTDDPGFDSGIIKFAQMVSSTLIPSPCVVVGVRQALLLLLLLLLLRLFLTFAGTTELSTPNAKDG